MKQLPYFAWAAVCKSVAHLCSLHVSAPFTYCLNNGETSVYLTTIPALILYTNKSKC